MHSFIHKGHIEDNYVGLEVNELQVFALLSSFNAVKTAWVHKQLPLPNRH